MTFKRIIWILCFSYYLRCICSKFPFDTVCYRSIEIILEFQTDDQRNRHPTHSTVCVVSELFVKRVSVGYVQYKLASFAWNWPLTFNCLTAIRIRRQRLYGVVIKAMSVKPRFTAGDYGNYRLAVFDITVGCPVEIVSSLRLLCSHSRNVGKIIKCV